MEKLGNLKLCLLILPFVFFLNLSGAVGQERCIVPTIPKNVEGIAELLALRWASGHPPAEIQPGTDAEVTVVAGFPPLQWSVSGNGFSLDKVEEKDVDHERSKLLIASPTACGTATITVTDSHNSVTGYVRSKAGTWVYKETCSLTDCDCKKYYTRWIYEISGYQQWIFFGYDYCCKADCGWSCSHPPACGTPDQCCEGHFSCEGYYGPYRAKECWYYEWECP